MHQFKCGYVTEIKPFKEIKICLHNILTPNNETSPYPRFAGIPYIVMHEALILRLDWLWL